MQTTETTTERQHTEMTKFWRHVFGGQKGLLQVWTGIRAENGKIHKRTIRSQFFNYPKAAESAAEWALERSREGREVYYCVHLCERPQRIKKNASEVITLWGEYDGSEVPNGELRPTAVVESSPGNYHASWRLTDAIPPELAEQLNKRIAHATGADPSGFDLTQLLRVPGTVNHKYPERPPVEIVELHPTRSYAPAELDALLPETEVTEEYEPEEGEDEPPVELDPEATKVWRGERPKLKENGEIDRSNTLYMIGAVLYDQGLTRAPFVAELRQRDVALGLRKYADNRDGGQTEYNRIYDKLKARGRSRSRSGSSTPSSDRFNLTDLGNAGRLIHHHGQNLRYCWLWGKWLVWDGKRWIKDDTGEVYRLAKETVASIYQEAAAAPDEDTRKALAKHAMRSESGARIKEMVDLARSDVPVMPDELDASPDLLNVENGTIDLRTGELGEHQRQHLITKIAPVEYQPDATAPAWEAFLERVLPSEDLRGFVQRAAGYSATGETLEQCIFINHGVGANGKSTAQETISAALGDYAMRTPTDMLLAKRAGGVPNDVARLKGSRFVTASETGEGRRLDEALIKDLTGQDTITARFMRAEWFDFRPTHKLWLSTNHKPEIRGTDLAVWRRIRLVPWSVTIPPRDQDKNLPTKLRKELHGIMAWIVRGCLEWRRGGLQAPDEVRRATGEYRAEMDVLAGFLADCCVQGSNESAYASELWGAWKRWCEETGEAVGTQKKFGGRLSERGFVNQRDSKTGRKVWYGLTLHPEWEARAELSLNHATLSFAGKTQNTEASEPKTEMNAKKTEPHEGECKKGSDGSDGSVEPPLSDDVDPGQSAMLGDLRDRRRLNEEQAQQVQQLIVQGMTPKSARAEVLGEGEDV